MKIGPLLYEAYNKVIKLENNLSIINVTDLKEEKVANKTVRFSYGKMKLSCVAIKIKKVYAVNDN